jgi:hypothetical protein
MEVARPCHLHISYIEREREMVAKERELERGGHGNN